MGYSIFSHESELLGRSQFCVTDAETVDEELATLNKEGVCHRKGRVPL